MAFLPGGSLPRHTSLLLSAEGPTPEMILTESAWEACLKESKPACEWVQFPGMLSSYLHGLQAPT